MNKVLKINEEDTVFVALVNLQKGEIHEGIQLYTDVPAKHKFAAHKFTSGDFLTMYGLRVARAAVDIEAGEIITTFNAKHVAEGYTTRRPATNWVKPATEKFSQRFFNGYHRADGSVGTANYWVVIPLVFCENQNVEIIKNALLTELGYAPTNKFRKFTKALLDAHQTGGRFEEITLEETPLIATNKVFEHIDGVKFLTHEGGCGGTREDALTLCRLLAGYVAHPNVAGATVLSLGCQNAQVKIFQEAVNTIKPDFQKPLYIFEQQHIGNEEQMLKEAIQHTIIGLEEANKARRMPAPLSALALGVECGGSDGFSGISANPAVGYCADLLVALGGKVMLAEFPELCGVEQELINRCVSDEVAEKFLNIQTAYARRAEAVGSGFDMNPSPGNIKDGLITDAMKSAGAAKKGGSSPVVSVLDYTEQPQQPGLHLLCTPGNDAECTTGLVGSGANVLLFTTGLGNPMGNPICPVLKVSSNSQLALKMADIIDIDSGGVITGEKTISEMGELLLEYCIATASGEYTPKAVAQNHDDFIPWKRGISL